MSFSSHFWKGFIKRTASNKITRARDAEDLFLPKITMTLGHPSCVAVRGYMGKGEGGNVCEVCNSPCNPNIFPLLINIDFNL